MKLSLVSIILLCFSLSAISQSIEITDKHLISKNRIKTKSLFEYEYINGKPDKGIKTRIDSFDIKGNKTGQVNFRETGTVQFTITSKYDQAGNRTQYAKFGHKYNFVQNTKYDSKSQKTLETGYNGIDTFKTVYNYNKQGKLAEVNYFIKKNLDEKRTFSYGEGTSEIKVLNQNGQLKFFLKYQLTPTGKVKEESQVEPDNTISRNIIYTYDKNDNLSSETKYLSGKLIQKITYVYNQSNQLIETWEEPAEGMKFLSHKYTYNTLGQLVEEQWKTEANKEYSKSIFTYDENGVVKTMDSYFANFKKQLLSVFVYEYH